MGFILGDAAFEATRTYRHVPFHLDWHLDRLYASLGYLRIDPQMSQEKMHALTLDVLARNVERLRPEDDVTLTHRITRGPHGGVFTGPPPGPPTVLITCRPTATSRFARFYIEGIELRVPSGRVPATGGVDPRVKTQSRLLFSMGTVEVADPGGHVLPLFIDTNGYITESSGSNVFFVTQGVLVTPPDDAVLGGITRRVLLRLAPQIGLNVECRPVHVKEVRAVDEAFVTSTGPAVLPVRLLDGQPLAPIPGPATKRLTAAYSDYVGVDIVVAALAHV